MSEIREHGSLHAADDKHPIPFATLRDLFRVSAKYKRMLAGVVLLSVVGAGTTLILPQYFTRFFSGDSFRIPSFTVIAGFVIIILTSAVISALQTYYLRKLGENMVSDIRVDLSEHLLNPPIQEYDRRTSGDLLSRLNNDASRLRDTLLQGITALASGSVLVIGSTIYMIFLNPILFSVTAVLLLMMLSLVLVSAKVVEKASFANQKDLGSLTSAMSRDLAGIRTIRAANASENEERVIRGIIGHVRRSGLKVAKVQAVIAPIANTGLELVAIIILGLGLLLVSTGRLSVPALTQFIMLVFIVISPLSQIMSTGAQTGEALAALSRIMGVLAIPEEQHEDAAIIRSLPKPRDASARTTAEAVEFHNVSFAYDGPDDSRQANDAHNGVLNDLNLRIRQGSSVALVGPSGAGKSTVLQLIERFYDPAAGCISILGADITSCSRVELRSHLAYVEQDSPTLSGTLRDNLLLGRFRTTDEECRQVLRTVNLGHLLTRSGQGLDLPVGEQGTTLSGGERQRLAIARALLSPAEIVLLDEATSDLDAQNERHVMHLLRNSNRRRTFLFVAHRLATVTDVDRIYVLEHGTIIGAGTHEELIHTIPLYRDPAKEQHLL